MLRVEPGAHFGAGARAGDVVQLGVEPVARGAAFLGGGDFHRLAVFQRGVERHHHAIHARAPAAVAQLGVQGVGKVHGRGAAGQVNQARVRRENVDAVVKQGLRCRGVRKVMLPGQQLAQHGNLGVIGAGGAHARVAFHARFLVGPVRGHAVFGVLVHGARADLHFPGLAVRVAHHRVQRLVAIDFGLGDVVVKLARHGRVVLVHPSQRGIAVLHRGHDHAQRAHVVDVGEIQLLAAHLAHDAVDVLGSPGHLGIHAQRAQRFFNKGAALFQRGFALGAALFQHVGNVPVHLRLLRAKDQVFHFPLDLPDAQPVGQRRENLVRLAQQRRRQGAPLGGKPAQRLQARSQPQQHHAQIAAESQQHLAHVFRLLARALRRGKLLAPHAREALRALQPHRLMRQPRKFGAKRLANDFFGAVELLAGIHQIGRRLYFFGAANVGQDFGHAIGMRQRVFA